MFRFAKLKVVVYVLKILTSLLINRLSDNSYPTTVWIHKQTTFFPFLVPATPAVSYFSRSLSFLRIYTIVHKTIKKICISFEIKEFISK